MMTRFPESKLDLKERTTMFTKEFVERYSRLTGKRTLHIVVSHGTPIRTFSRQHGGEKKKIRFCGVTAVAITPHATEEPKFRLLCNCKHNHEKESSYCRVQ